MILTSPRSPAFRSTVNKYVSRTGIFSFFSRSDCCHHKLRLWCLKLQISRKPLIPNSSLFFKVQKLGLTW